MQGIAGPVVATVRNHGKSETVLVMAGPSGWSEWKPDELWRLMAPVFGFSGGEGD